MSNFAIVGRKVVIAIFFLFVFLSASVLNAACSLRSVPHFDLKMKTLLPETDNSALDDQTCENESESEQETEYSSESITFLLPYYSESNQTIGSHIIPHSISGKPKFSYKQPLQAVYQLFRI